MNSYLASILAGNFIDLEEKLEATCSISDWQQVLRYSSRRAFDSSTVDSELLSIVSKACDTVLASNEFDLILYVKSIYYILQVAAKQDDCPTLLAVLPRVITVVAKCYQQPDTHSFLKSLYQVTWNTSLRCQEPRVALKLQRFALTFLLVTAPDAVNKVASLTDLAAANFRTKGAERKTQVSTPELVSIDEEASKQQPAADDDTVSFYHQILSSIFTHVNFTKKLEHTEVISIMGLLTHCNIHQHASLLKYSLKTLKGFCSGPCYSAVYTGLQVLQSALRTAAEDASAKFDAAVSALLPYKVTIAQDETARAVALHCLLAALAALEDTNSQEMTYRLPVARLESLLLAVVDLTPADTTQQTKLKVAAALCHFMRTLVIQLRSVSSQGKSTATSSSCSSSPNVEALSTDHPEQRTSSSNATSLSASCQVAARWSSLAWERLAIMLPSSLTTDNKFHYHNLGVCCGNLGVLCFRVNEFDSASACLTACIALQDSYVSSAPSEWQQVAGSVHKKRSLLCDALRYTGRYEEAAQALADQTMRYAVEAATYPPPAPATLRDGETTALPAPTLSVTVVPVEALVLQWIKLKRDALKANNLNLQGALLSAAVRDQSQHSGDSLDLTDLLTQLLLQEYSAYSTASWDCSAEQERCGVLLLSLARGRLRREPRHTPALKHAVRSVLMVAQVLYTNPERAVREAFIMNVFESLDEWSASDPSFSTTIVGNKQMYHPCCYHHPVAEAGDDECPALHLLSTALSFCSFAAPARTNECFTDEKAQDREREGRRQFVVEDVPEDWRETVAEVHFWLYLALLQKYQITKKQEEDSSRSPRRSTSAAPASLTAAATDLGEEQQPDDACDVRSNTAALLRSPPHQHALQHLDAALTAWTLAKNCPLDDSTNLCRLLTAAGHAFRLHGHTHRTAQCWSMLVHCAHRHQLHTYTLRGLVEQIWTCPELCSERVAASIREQLSASAGGRHDAQATLLANVALALHHLTHGRVSEGWPVLQDVLRHELVVEKKTVRATEVQCLAHYVASHYSLLPTSRSPCEGGDAPLNPVALAQIAAREAIALTHAVPDQPDLHSSERVTWLHQLTSAWLARLSLLTAQPRLARAYLKQPLMMAHQLALPYRAASVLSILAEVDLLCDQREDCRVKVDALLAVFSPFSQPTPREHRAQHQSAREKGFSNTVTPKKLNLVGHDVLETKSDTFAKKLSATKFEAAGKENTFVSSLTKKVPKIRIEAIRQARTSSDSGGSSPCALFGDEDNEDDNFLVRDGQTKLGFHRMVGIEAKLKYLSLTSTHLDRNKLDKDRSLCPGSPSLDHREAATLMPHWNPQPSMPLQPVDMNRWTNISPNQILVKEKNSLKQKQHVPTDLRPYCPGFNAIYLNTASMLSALHWHGNRWQPAAACIQTASEAYKQMQLEVLRLSSVITSTIDEHTPSCAAAAPRSKKHPTQVTDALSKEDAAQLFTANTFVVPWSFLQQTAVQLLAAREQWKEAAQRVVTAVTTVTTWPQPCLVRHHSYLLPLLLQSKHLQCVLQLPVKDSSRLLSPSRVNSVSSPCVPLPSTPDQSPTQQQLHRRPPPIRRTPLNFARNGRGNVPPGDHRRKAKAADISDDSCDSSAPKDCACEDSNSLNVSTGTNMFHCDPSSSVGDASLTKEGSKGAVCPTSSELSELDAKLNKINLNDSDELSITSSSCSRLLLNSTENEPKSNRVLSSRSKGRTSPVLETKIKRSTSSSARLKATASSKKATVLSKVRGAVYIRTNTPPVNSPPSVSSSLRILPKKTDGKKTNNIKDVKEQTRKSNPEIKLELSNDTNARSVASPNSMTKPVGNETNARSNETNARSVAPPNSMTKPVGNETNARSNETNARSNETNARSNETNARSNETNARSNDTNARSVASPNSMTKPVGKTYARVKTSRTCTTAAVISATTSQQQTTAEPTATVRSSRLRSTRCKPADSVA